MGRRTKRTQPGLQTETFGYDLLGNLIRHTNFNGIVITNQYDALNRLTNRSSINGHKIEYAYSPTGRRTTMTDPSGVTSYAYDNRDRLQLKTVAWSGGPAISLNYRFDANGNLTNLWSSTAGGATNFYRYDSLSRLTNAIGRDNVSADYGFDGVGNLQTVRYGNGVTNLHQYDRLNRLTNTVWKLNANTLGSFYYKLGLSGARTNLDETVNGAGRTCQWQYDPLYRLTNEVISALGSAGYKYDPVGNRTNRTSTISQLPTVNSTYNTNDWLAGDVYDANGNTRTNAASQPYFYDVENRLTNFNNGAVILTYDGDGSRVKKVAGGVTTYYLVDDRNPSGYAQVLEEWTSTGTPSLSKVYNYGLDLISQRTLNPQPSTNYFVYDGHGSTRVLTDAGGNVANAFVYDAYGTLIASNTTAQTAYLYCGEQLDGDLGFYYLRARYYKTDTGRFWTMDSYEGNSEDPLSLHKYLYCHNDPVNRIDPSGLADYLLAIGYHGTEIGDPESWADWYNMTVYGNAFRKHTITALGILPRDDIYAVVTGKVGQKHLVLGTDRITKIIITGHGSAGTLGGLWEESDKTSDFTHEKLTKPNTPHARLLAYLKPFTEGHSDVELRACGQAKGTEGKKFMLTMSSGLGANVISFDDQYAVWGWGNEWTARPNGTFEMTRRGKPYKGLSSFLTGITDLINLIGVVP